MVTTAHIFRALQQHFQKHLPVYSAYQRPPQPAQVPYWLEIYFPTSLETNLGPRTERRGRQEIDLILHSTQSSRGCLDEFEEILHTFFQQPSYHIHADTVTWHWQGCQAASRLQEGAAYPVARRYRVLLYTYGGEVPTEGEPSCSPVFSGVSFPLLDTMGALVLAGKEVWGLRTTEEGISLSAPDPSLESSGQQYETEGEYHA